MGCGASRVKCPKCEKFESKDGESLLNHVEKEHTITCSTCGLKGFSSMDALSNHFQKLHISIDDSYEDGDINTDVVDVVNASYNEASIMCPKCNDVSFNDGETFLEHLQTSHELALHSAVCEIANNNNNNNNKNNNNNMSAPKLNKNLKVGDKILAMWSRSKWQYFHATIVRCIPSELKYEIDWDDGDTTGRIVDYYNVAVDKVPDVKNVGIGSIILFPQGQYQASGTQLTGGKRWHQGKITNIYKRDNTTYYDGIHTKGTEDGKWVTHKGFSKHFTRYQLEDFRVGPNVFDIIEDTSDATKTEDIDIYFSFSGSDSGFTKVDSNICDPADIVADLKVKGLNVVNGSKDNKNEELKVKLQKMKNSKVFVACITDEYALNDDCRMEFQYAKSTLKKPVVPLVFGDGMEWMMTVVGMLLAGELYIHFKDKSVQKLKFEEMLKSLSQHISKNIDSTVDEDEKHSNLPPGDVFISYCWSNSYLAQQNKQINTFSGTEFSDPRLISSHLNEEGIVTWLDIERLKSADKNAGLFEQLTKALREAKVFVPFISDEYAKSANCRMELQFSLKYLGKRVIPVVVGKGSMWKETAVGMLLESNDVKIINLQNEDNETSFRIKLKEIIEAIKKNLNVKTSPRKQKLSRAPTMGDHVICHHVNYCYYTATVIGYNISTMEYTVNWDDGDPSGRVQMYNQVALDVVPDPDDVGVDSIIFFPQGSYGATVGNNDGGIRYHEGIITKVTKTANDILFNGHHTRGVEDGKSCMYRGYEYEFLNISIQEIRIAPSALDAVTR